MGYPKYNKSKVKIYRYTKDELKNETIVAGFPKEYSARISDQSTQVMLKGSLVTVEGYVVVDKGTDVKESDTLEVDGIKRVIKGVQKPRGLSNQIVSVKVYYA